MRFVLFSILVLSATTNCFAEHSDNSKAERKPAQSDTEDFKKYMNTWEIPEDARGCVASMWLEPKENLLVCYLTCDGKRTGYSAIKSSGAGTIEELVTAETAQSLIISSLAKRNFKLASSNIESK